MPDFLVFAAIIPKLFKAKIIIDVHDLMPELYMSKFQVDGDKLLIKLITFLERRSISFAHKAIAVHEPHLKALTDHGNLRDKFIILLNVPDQTFFEKVEYNANKINSHFRIIYHGTIARRYGLDIAIKAVSILKDKIPGLEFLIVGMGDDTNRLEQLVKKLDLQPYVKFHSPILFKELVPVIMQSHLGVIPIIEDEFTVYTIPTKLLDYVALGIPTVITRLKSVESYFDDDMVCYFESAEVDELANIVYDLYIDEDKRNLLVRNANKFNQLYNWNNQKQIYYRMIDSLVK